jgi:HEAT repeat protein
VKGHYIDELLQATHDPDPGVRKVATRELCPCEVKVNDPRVWDRVLQMAADPDRDVRRIALHTLIDGSPRSREHNVVHALEGRRDDSDPKLRRNVRKILARYRATGKLNFDGH